jgi:transcriptional regulator with XRE-family HTH domain
MIYETRRAILEQFFEYRRMISHSGQAQQVVFAKRLREARARLGIPQDKLGVLIGLDESSSSARISRYEAGIHEPPIRTAKLLAQVLNVPLAYLYCDDDALAAILLKVHAMSVADRKRLLATL